MASKVEGNLRSLIREFKIIKKSLQPLMVDIKKIKAIEVEFRKFKGQTDSQLKKLNFDARRLSSAKSSATDSKKLALLENKIVKEQKTLERNLKQRIDSLSSNFKKVNLEKAGIESEEFEKLALELKKIENKLSKNSKRIDEKHTSMHSANRQMIASLLSDFNYFKKHFEKESRNIEKSVKKLEDIEKWFKERDKHLTKEMNIRKRHINQMVEELNDARKRDQLNAKTHGVNKKLLTDLKGEFVSLSNKLNREAKILKTKADQNKIDDILLTFTRLEKKTTTDVGEIKGRMREIERKNIGKKDIDNIKKDLENIKIKLINKKEIDNIQTELMEKLNSELDTINSKVLKVSKDAKATSLKKEIKEIKTLISENERKDDNYFNLFKKETSALKAEISLLNQKIGRLGEMPRKDQYDYMRNVITRLKTDVDKNTDSLKSFKKDIAITMGKTNELYSLKEPMKGMNKEVLMLNNKLESNLQNIRNELNGINIKVENTSKLLKDLGKVL